METRGRATGQQNLFGDDDPSERGDWEPAGPAFEPPAQGVDDGTDEDEAGETGDQFRTGPGGGRYLNGRAMQGECSVGGRRAIVALGYLLPCHSCGRALLATGEAGAIEMATSKGWEYWRGHNVCAGCLRTHRSATAALAQAGRVAYEETIGEYAAALDLEEHGRPQADGTVLIEACPTCMVGQIQEAGLAEGFLRCDHCLLAWGLPKDQGVLGDDEG